jgi:hypothetical protein
MDKKNPQGDRRKGQQPSEKRTPTQQQPGSKPGEKEKREYRDDDSE